MNPWLDVEVQVDEDAALTWTEKSTNRRLRADCGSIGGKPVVVVMELSHRVSMISDPSESPLAIIPLEVLNACATALTSYY